MTVAFAADHAGFDMKQWLIAALSEDGHELVDLGTNNREPMSSHWLMMFSPSSSVRSSSLSYSEA